MIKRSIALFLLMIPLTLWAEKRKAAEDQVDPRLQPKTIQAVRINEPVLIDGRLEEKVWQMPGRSDFFQSDPVDGGQPTEQTEVWVAYDDKNLYVAAFCHDSEPKSIRALLGRRDDELDSDWFSAAIDPYFDRRTGYEFFVNPAGSVQDMALSNDVNSDSSWDAVWESKARITAEGWVAEIKVPFNQIRFPKATEYVWGVDFRRTIKRKNEKDAFVWIPKDQNAYVSRFARLEGIRDIHPGPHLEVFPYGVGQAEFKPAEAGNPFETGHHYLGDFGFDVKAGLQSNLTLDATVNPDFGQVEVDPAVINLSAYETYYEEKRPFFIEGASLFNGFGRGGVYLDVNINWPQPRFFYSRRVGRAPEGSPQHAGFVDFPDRTNILGAAKLTGQLAGGWNVGFINALTAREFADVDDGLNRFRDEVEPLTYYGVFRAQKDIDQGQSGFGVMATGVLRDLRDPSLAGLLNKNAFTLAVDGWAFLDPKRNWVIGGWLGGTRVSGTPGDILGVQESSIHYYQRPDADYLHLDPNATSLSGWGGRFSLAKEQGSFLFLTSVGALSPGFEPNDAGYQYSGSDLINANAVAGWQWTKPGKVFRYLLLAAGPYLALDFGGNATGGGGFATVQGTFVNYWEFNLQAIYMPPALSHSLTRGGPLALIPTGYDIELTGQSDNRRPIVFELQNSFLHRPRSGYDYSGQLLVRWKPRTNVSLSLGPLVEFAQSDLQWVTNVVDPLMTSTFGSRYVFAHLDEKVLGAEIRLNWIFTPKLSLQLYLQPYLAVGKYERFRELARARAFEYNIYGTGDSTIAFADGVYNVDPDGSGPAAPFSFDDPGFNVKSLRGTIVLRWEYLPGSLFYLVWTQDRADFAHPGDLRLGRDLGDLFSAPGDNIFLLKMTYRWSL